MRMIGKYLFRLRTIQDMYGEELGKKIDDSFEDIKVKCLNDKCKEYNIDTQIPAAGGGFIYCLDCNQLYRVPVKYNEATKYWAERSKSKKKSVHQEIWVQCSDNNCKDYHHHFQIREASLPLRVCPECKLKLKKVEGKVNPNTEGSGIIHPDKTEDNKKKSSSSFGSGFFVNKEGFIVTNFHVIKDSNKIKFIYKGDKIDAKVVATDEQLDLALLKSEIKNKDFIKFSTKSPQKAQSVLVAGYPFGKIISDDLKITGGIINSLKGGGNNTTQFQLDATINPGNSGGPIVDKMTGNLVGVAVQKLNKDFTKAIFGAESENTNYGIKASQVKDFLEANNLKTIVKRDKLKMAELENSTVFIYSE